MITQMTVIFSYQLYKKIGNKIGYDYQHGITLKDANVKWYVGCDPGHSFHHNIQATMKRSDQVYESRVQMVVLKGWKDKVLFCTTKSIG